MKLYDNEVMTLIIRPHHTYSWNWSYRLYKRVFEVSYVRGSIHYAIQYLSPRARLHCICQNLHNSKDRNSNELGQVTLVAKQLDSTTPRFQAVFFENFSYLLTKTSGCTNPAAATKLAWCGEVHLTTLTAHLAGNGGNSRMSSALQAQTARWLAFQ
jgi:hypothetical protein